MPRDRRKVARALKHKGFRMEQGGRDHDFFFLETTAGTEAIYTKVSRGTSYKTLDDRVLGKIRRQLKLEGGELDDLLDCPLTEQGYRGLLVKRGILASA